MRSGVRAAKPSSIGFSIAVSSSMISVVAPQRISITSKSRSLRRQLAGSLWPTSPTVFACAAAPTWKELWSDVGPQLWRNAELDQAGAGEADIEAAIGLGRCPLAGDRHARPGLLARDQALDEGA